MKELIRSVLRLLLLAGLLCVGLGIWVWATTLGKGGTDFEYSKPAYWAFAFGAIVIGLMAAATAGLGLEIFREKEANRRSRDQAMNDASPAPASKDEGAKEGAHEAADHRAGD